MKYCHKFFNVSYIKINAKASRQLAQSLLRNTGLTRAFAEWSKASNGTSSSWTYYNNMTRAPLSAAVTPQNDDPDTINMSMVKAAVFITVMVVVLLCSSKVLIEMFSRMNNAVSRRDEEQDMIEDAAERLIV